ncbi:DUF4111 domain-containing protein [Chloroflexota bacterium]|nr:DUF4111 domain-containing protein [Chloroflexota bacterium]
MAVKYPVPDRELNEILNRLVDGIKPVLGPNFLGGYLGGSFAHGGWDVYSDVDFTIVIEEELDPRILEDLKVVHARVFTINHYWARHLEGSYFPRSVLSDLNRTNEPLWYLDNGSLNFERSMHDNTLVNRWVLREYGLILQGPEPSIWIPRIPEIFLKAEVWWMMREWGGDILSGAYRISSRFSQTFTVLNFCRMLYTLSTGRVQSKQTGAAWARAILATKWVPLIDDALSARVNQYQRVYDQADPGKIRDTRDFIRYALMEVKNLTGFQN